MAKIVKVECPKCGWKKTLNSDHPINATCNPPCFYTGVGIDGNWMIVFVGKEKNHIEITKGKIEKG